MCLKLLCFRVFKFPEFTPFSLNRMCLIETVLLSTLNYIWAATRENLSSGFSNNKGEDQPPHRCCLISTFVIHFLESMICKLATCTCTGVISISEAEETGLKFALSETPKTGFFATRPICFG